MRLFDFLTRGPLMSSFTDPLASYSSTAFTPDRLLVDTDDLLSRKVTVLTGQNLVRGSVIGQITLGAAVAAAKGGGNTGTGTLVMDGATPILANAALSGPGVYTVRCVVAAANGGTFVVVDPKGVQIGTINATLGGAVFADRIKFTLTANGGGNFIVGDGFDITIAAGSGKYVLSLAAAVDGSQIPDAVLAEATDATAADKEAMAYYRGRFNDAAVTLGAGQTVAGIREGLRQKGIDLIAVQAA